MSDYKYGQKIMVQEDKDSEWCERIYIATTSTRVICVNRFDEDAFKSDLTAYRVLRWKYHKPYERKVKSNTHIVGELLARGFKPDKFGNWVNDGKAFSPNYLFGGEGATKPEWMLEDTE